MGQVLIVVVLAAAAGVGVYKVSLRWSVDPQTGGGLPGAGFTPAPEPETPSPARRTPTVTARAASPSPQTSARDPATGYLYVPLAPGRRSWQTRVFGLVGLVIVVSVTAAVLAFSLYQGGHLLNKGMKGYFDTGTPTPSATASAKVNQSRG